MNRFEQKSMSFGRKLVYLLPILAFLVLFVLFLQGIGSVSESTLTKQQESLETALGRSISQCYAVEGCYPPSLEYLEQHYGLLYDKNSFFVDYEYYGMQPSSGSHRTPQNRRSLKEFSDIMNNRNQEKHFIVDILFVLALFGVFASLRAGARYHRSGCIPAHRGRYGCQLRSRTAVSYILEKGPARMIPRTVSLWPRWKIPRLSACFHRIAR